MDNHDKQSFAEIMLGVAENFSASISDAGLAIRFAALAEHSIEDVRNAAMHIIKNRKYTTMPTTADFLEFISGGSAEDVALLQAANVWQAMQDHGSYSCPVFDDPVTMAVIHNVFGGWIKLCSETQVSEQKWFIKDFVAAYGSYSRTGVKRYGELDGRGSKTVFIGNPDKAKQVLEQKQIEQDSAIMQKLIDTDSFAI